MITLIWQNKNQWQTKSLLNVYWKWVDPVSEFGYKWFISTRMFWLFLQSFTDILWRVCCAFIYFTIAHMFLFFVTMRERKRERVRSVELDSCSSFQLTKTTQYERTSRNLDLNLVRAEKMTGINNFWWISHVQKSIWTPCTAIYLRKNPLSRRFVQNNYLWVFFIICLFVYVCIWLLCSYRYIAYAYWEMRNN